MTANEFVGLLIGGIMTLAGAFYFFHDRIMKNKQEQHDKEMRYIREQNEFREKQLRATERTNHLLEAMNGKFDRIDISDEKQNKAITQNKEQLVIHSTRLDTHEEDIKTIKATVYKKHRVD